MKSVPGYRAPIGEVAKLSGHATDETVEFAAISPDGVTVLSGSADKMAILWDRKTGKGDPEVWPHGRPDHLGPLLPRWSPCLTAGEDKIIRLWDLADGHLIRRIQGT